MQSKSRRATALRVVCDATEKVSRVLLGLSIVGVVFITCLAVWYRYVLDAPLSWTEQISRILFVWLTFVGAAVLYRSRLHIAIDMMVLMLPKPLQRIVYWINEALTLFLAVMLLWFGGRLSLSTMSQTFGALEISPASFYFAAPVTAALIILYWIEKLVDPSRRFAHGEVHL